MALQMTWQPSLLHHRRKNGPPLGLRNLGNSCYLNSVLQCLTYTPPLANFCLNNQHSSNCDSAIDSEQKRDCPFCILERRIVRSLSVDHPQDAPVRISKCLRIFAEHFRSGRQEDAHEFLRYVIDACHNTCLRLKKLQQQRRKVGLNNRGEGFNSSTVVKEIFGGCLQSQVKCLSCGNESNKVDEIMDISLDVLQSGSVKESLQNFFQPEVLDGNNKYKCENCKKLVAARKQMSIFQAPNVLVIQLKRFEGIFGGKIDKAIAFEEVLVLSSYVCKASQDPHPEYHLFGTIVHSGFSPDSGHYYAYIKDAMGRWYCCNDSYVSLSSLQEVLSEKAYILFFSRTKQRPVTASTVSVSNGVKSQDSNGILPSKVLKSAGPIQTMHTQQFVDHSSGKENSTVSKVDKISSFGNSTATKFPASVNGKIVFNKIQSNGKNGVVRASTCMEKSEKDITSSISSNGIDKRKTVDAVDGENSPGFHLYQSNKKNGDVNTSICRENGEKDVTPLISSNGICNGKTVDAVNGENSRGFPLNQSNKKNGDARASACRENGGKDMTPLISSNGVFKGKAVDGENSQGFPLNQSKERNGDVSASISGEKSEKHMALLRSSNSICKSKAVDETDGENIQESPLKSVEVKGLRTTLNSTGADISGNSDKRNRVMLESGNNHNEPLNGGRTTDGLKRKSRSEDSCILFAKDDHTRTELAELKLVLGNEASLVLRSCGWLDEVHSFMHLKKKFCAQELGNSASNVHELKKSLIRHAKLTFLSQIPESLKETLIERLKIAGEGKQHPRPSASKQGARYSTSPN